MGLSDTLLYFINILPALWGTVDDQSIDSEGVPDDKGQYTHVRPEKPELPAVKKLYLWRICGFSILAFP